MNNSDPFEEAVLEWDLDRLFRDLVRVRGSRLTEMETLYFKGVLLGYGAREIALRTCKAPDTVRDYLSKRIYRYVETLLDLPSNSIRGSQLPKLLADYRRPPEGPGDRPPFPQTVRPLQSGASFQLVPLAQTVNEWDEVPEVRSFYGRSMELSQLMEWVAAGCRVITIAGSPGIGKTTLAAAFADRVRSRFSRVVWRSLRDTPLLTVLLSDLTTTLGGSSQPMTSTSIESQIGGLLRLLQQSRSLLVLDNADGLFEDGSALRAYRKGYENYGALFQRLGEVKHDSCILLTGWEGPAELEHQGGRERPVQVQRLKGLEPPDAKLLLAEYDLRGQEEWDSLIQLYRGNPYSLKVVAAHILEVFGGDVLEFWNEQTIFLGEISNLLHAQFLRLSELEKNLVGYLAHQLERLVLRSELQKYMEATGSRSQVNEAIAALKRRSFIEEAQENGHSGYSLPPVVLKYVRSQTLVPPHPTSENVLTNPSVAIEEARVDTL